MTSYPDPFHIRLAEADEYEVIGQLMVQVYSQLEGFPKADKHPKYYDMLANIGNLAKKPGVELLVSANEADQIGGTVVYFDDMTQYGAQGIADGERDAGGFRLLAVDPGARGLGIGRQLTAHCLEKANSAGKAQMVIHSTKAMQVAWRMYEKMGFQRYPDLDFTADELEIFGFRLRF